MDTPKRSYWHTAPRSALRNVSNGQSASICGLSSFDRYKTPGKESRGVLSASAKRIYQSIRRELSKSHGDLSNLRPKSPPIQNMPALVHGLHLSPGRYVDDTQNFFSPGYNRQIRQAIPNDWMTGASGIHPPTITEDVGPASQQNFHSPLHDLHVSHHMEAEPAAISIQGLTSGYIQPLDFCVPVTRSHPGIEDQRREVPYADTGHHLAVEHINISTAWNGLSDVDANELFRVHQAFVSTLEKMVANELWQIYQQQDSAVMTKPIHTLFSVGIVRGISFCRDQLVSEMVKALYSSKENAAKAKSGFLRLYLIATDTLVQHREDSSRDTSITIRMRCDPSSLRPHPAVDAAWVPDSLMFKGLDEFPLEGQSFSIVPRYYSKSAFRPTRFPENVKYSIESESRHSPLSWLVWDDEIAGFEGVVPFYSEANGYDRHVTKTDRDCCEGISHSLKIIVQAVLVDDNGSSIRYERILRARLTIKVAPWYVNRNSCENKEFFGVPKAYQDRRFVSAAHRFALHGHRGSLCYPEQSPSELFQRSKRSQLHTPTEYVRAGQVGFRDGCSAISSSATGAGLKESDMPSLAQTQAYLVAKCAELTRELESVKEQIIMSGPSGEHHKRMLRAPDLQKSTNHTVCVPFDLHTGQSERISRSSVPHISHHASEYLTTPKSPSLHGREAAFQLGSSARFPALPPPAIGLTTRPRSNLQTKDRSAVEATCTGWDSTPRLGTTSQLAASGGLMTQSTHPTQESGYLWHLPERPLISSHDTGTASSSRQRYVEALSNPVMVKGITGKRNRKRRARSSLNKPSHIKRSEESEKQPKQEIGTHSAEPCINMLPPLDPKDEASCCLTRSSSGIFYNSFGPLQNLDSSATLADEEILASHASERGACASSRENLELPQLDSNCFMNIKNGNIDELASETSLARSRRDDGARTGKGLSSTLPFPGWNGQGHPYQSPSASSSPRHTNFSSSSGSSSTSSDIEFIVEQDRRAREESRQEQAKSWRLFSRSDSNKVCKPGPGGEEVRLSEDEKKAMDEAMQRSLDDLAEGFDDIFLEDSSGSNSGDSDL